ncbi:Autoinducer 2 import ATP-binding protein LsrA [archaeon HR01]|nr:Autoinducer 2 import ATP-binding protein LsrA [archaeon HR01]
MVEGQTVLRAENISKSFGTVKALNNVSFDLRRGEIHGLLGENGAGKTTLCNILYGMVRPDSGKIYLNDVGVRFTSPRDAMAMGIGMVHQEFTLIPNLSVVDNVVLFTENSGLLMNRSEAAERVERYGSEYGLKVNPYVKVSELSAGEKQRLEILKVLMRGARILILDEPTSVLTRIETVELFRALEKMAADGRSVILVTHKMDDVLSSAHRITVLRQGVKVATLENRDVDRSTLARLIVNRDVVFSLEKPVSQAGGPLLQIQDLRYLDTSGVEVLKRVRLEVRAGEVVGICGVAGNGQKELVETVVGVLKPTSGKIFLNGREVSRLPPSRRRELGMAYIPEEFTEGLVPDFKLWENIVLSTPISARLSSRGLLNPLRVRAAVEDLIKTYQIKTSSPDAFTWSLSGGNKQKLLLAREFYQKPTVIVAHNPTKGLDIAATEYVRRALLELRSQGKGVLLVSNDLDEVVEMSDRLMVMHAGRIVGEFSHQSVDLDRVARLMLGAS